jgi:hypothetical protein
MKPLVKILALAALLGLQSPVHAADVIASNGIGDSADPWLATIQLIKFDLTSRIPVVIKTGDELSTAPQLGPISKVTVPRLGSMSWCDPAANPIDPGNTNIAECFGSAADSQLLVLDLNKVRKKGAKKAYLRLILKAYDDGDHTLGDADEDLIPALTVYSGRPEQGQGLSWYPNKYQNDPALSQWQLKPFTGKDTNNSSGWTTGFFGDNSSHQVVLTGKLTLKAGNQNYWIVAIGGDARHSNIAAKHPVNFKLSVLVDSKPLLANGGGNDAEIDVCGCTVGVTQWHPAMQHCMSISLCDLIAGNPDDHCKTPEMCKIDGGR